MDYKKAYKEALERARDYYKANIKLDKADENLVLEDIFPELKENGDEKIRKALIEYFNEQCDMSDWNGVYGYQVVAWLEKQGKQETDEWKEGNIIRHGGVLALVIKGRRAMKSNGEIFTVQYPDEWVKAAPNEIEHFLNELEKQGKKPQGKTALEAINDEKVDNDNKVEPKFKVGDWIVNRGHSYLIADIDNLEHRYLFEIGGYTHEQLNWEYIELADKRYHLWSIEDANDGDILVGGDWIFILKQFNPSGNNHRCYCHYDLTLDYFKDDTNSYMVSGSNDFKPATKQQRDLLFAKMHEAGYEWDEEKKESKKIEPFNKYEGLTDFERTLADICIGWIGEEFGWKQYIKNNADILLKIAIEKFNSVQDAPFEHKSACSEDETSLAIKNPEAYKIGFADGEAHAKEEMITEWSKEDEEMLTEIITDVKFAQEKNPQSQANQIFFEGEINWLNSLKEKYTWKPSDEQMKALHDINLTGNISYAGQGHTLIELYNDLKKLTE